MKFFRALFFSVFIIFTQYSICCAQAIISPVKVLRNAATDKAVANLIRTKDSRYTYANDSDGRYKLIKSKGVEIWVGNYSKSVEVYKYTVNMSVASVKRELTKLGADFSGGNYAYMSNGDPNSSCYSVQLEPINATSTRVSYSYECD